MGGFGDQTLTILTDLQKMVLDSEQTRCLFYGQINPNPPATNPETPTTRD